MEVWQDASSSDKSQFEAVRTVCAKHPEILRFLFNQQKPELRSTPEQLLFEARGFSSGQFAIIKIAIDLWSGCTVYSDLNEILYTLDSDNFSNVILALVKLRGQRLEFLDYISF
jgi:hypothetical protein